MYTKPISLTELILAEERQFSHATGTLTLLLTRIQYAAKIIASHVRQAGLVDILGTTNRKNVFSDEVQKLDDFSNRLFIETVSTTGVVSHIASEELAKPLSVTKDGKYDVLFDPLDGSANTDVNASVGTIFSIYKSSADLLQPGKEQVAAGYILYGSSTMFVYSSGRGVNGFTFDPSIGSFLLSHPSMTIPSTGSLYSVNEANYSRWDKKTQLFIDSLRNGEKQYKSRYIGCMVADVHRILIKGGVFLYPADSKSPEGKLRLMYEVNPLSFLVSNAGGKAVSNGQDPLEITPTLVHQTVPVVLGSTEEVTRYQTTVHEKH